MISFLIWLIGLLMQVLTFLILVHVILSYFMSPYHPVRQTIDKILDPMLAPIRRLVPSAAGLDFSPIILWIVIQFVGQVLIRLLVAVG